VVALKPQIRKVQKLGLSSLGISLPKGWAKGLALEAGSTVVVHPEEDGSLRITTDSFKPRIAPRECVVDADNCTQEGYLERLILAGYMVGCSTIRVKARGELEQGRLDEVQRALSKLTGVTPVDQGTKYLTLENFAEPSKFPVEGLIRRLQFLVSRMQDLTFQMASKGGDVRDQIRSSRQEVERLYNFVVRQLLLAAQEPTVARQIGLEDSRHIVGARAFAMLMQGIADNFMEIADSWIVLAQDPMARSGPVGKELATLWSEMNDLAETTMGAFFGRDLARANEAMERVDQVLAAIQGAATKVSFPREDQGPAYCTTCLSLQSVLRPLRNVARLYGSIAQVAMNRGVEKVLRRAEARPEGAQGVAVPIL
jgi:phosphate uptake regulator